MGRGKGALRKESSHDVGMVGRRSYMEHLHPLPPTPLKRPPDRSLNRPPKRPRPSPAAPPNGIQAPPPNFLYAPNRHIDVDKLLANAPSRQVVVHIYADYLTSFNPAIKNRLLWGTDVYTEDSDVVAILLHTGYYVPPATKSTAFDFLSVRIRVDRHVRRESPAFEPSDRNRLRSRPWSSLYDGGRLSILGVSVFKGDKCVETQPRLEPRRVPLPGLVMCPAPAPPGAKKTPVIDSVVSFDMVNRPCLKYNLNQVTSVSLGEKNLPFTRLAREVLYVENDRDRFEIYTFEEGNHRVRFARVKRSTVVREILAITGSSNDIRVPLTEADREILAELSWGDLYWDLRGVTVRGKHYRLSKMSFRRRDEHAEQDPVASADNG